MLIALITLLMAFSQYFIILIHFILVIQKFNVFLNFNFQWNFIPFSTLYKIIIIFL